MNISKVWRNSNRTMKTFNCYIVIMVLAFLLLDFMAVSSYAELRITPTISVSEEYNDNLFETETNRKSDYITRTLPGLSFLYTAPFWKWDLAYNFDYRHYARGLRNDENTHNLRANGSLNLIENLLFLDVSDVYSRVSLDVARNAANEGLFVNQTDQNLLTVSPYFQFRPTDTISLKTGYVYTNNWYSDPRSPARSRHSGLIELSYTMNPKVLVTTTYRMDREDSSIGRFYRHELYAGPRYEYAERSFISAMGGLSRTDYDRGLEVMNPYWSVGVTHSFDTVTANLSSSIRYTDDPLGGAVRESNYISLSLQKTIHGGSLGIISSYSELYDINRQTTTTERLTAGVNGNYEIYPHLNARVGFTFENYRYVSRHGTTRRYYADTGLTYSFGNDLSLGISYRHAAYDSPQIAEDNMRVNRIILEISKSFTL